MALTDADVTWGVIIAAIIILFAVCVWPGTARASPKDFAGYWASTDGDLYEIRQQGSSSLEIRGTGASARAGSGAKKGAGSPSRGWVSGFRRIRAEGLPSGSRSGALELGGRALAWDGGEKWYRQGVLIPGRA